jgi:hypothetical protein
MSKQLTVKELISLVDTHLLDEVAEMTDVNHQVKKLSGQTIFKLLLMSLLDNTKVSLRVLEQLFSNSRFKVYAATAAGEHTRFNSLSDRLSHINVAFFAELFRRTYVLCQGHLGKSAVEGLQIRPFDSTVITASSRLMRHGMLKDSLRQIKFTVGLKGGLPSDVLFFNDQQHLAEDLTLREILMQASFEPDQVAVFDRGLKKRVTFQELKNNGIFFVTRINPTKSMDVIRSREIADPLTRTLKITSDQDVYLYHRDKRKLNEPFRLVKATSLENEGPLWFITNLDEEVSAAEITEIYRHRWEIEVFFKFIKQQLHVRHFLSYSENGVQVMMYMSMIAAMLLLTYKSKNQIKGYKIAKYQFVNDLDMEIIREIVLMCGGDPAKSPLFSPP